jgi:hypothetical protein
LNRFIEGLHRFLVALQVLQRHAQVLQILGLRILADRAGDPFHGNLKLLLVQRKKPHEIKSVRMGRINRKRPLTALDCVEVPPAISQAEAFFAKTLQRRRR